MNSGTIRLQALRQLGRAASAVSSTHPHRGRVGGAGARTHPPRRLPGPGSCRHRGKAEPRPTPGPAAHTLKARRPGCEIGATQTAVATSHCLPEENTLHMKIPARSPSQRASSPNVGAVGGAHSGSRRRPTEGPAPPAEAEGSIQFFRSQNKAQNTPSSSREAPQGISR